MKKIIYVLIVLIVIVSGLLYRFAPFTYRPEANREIKKELTKKSIPKPLTAKERKAELKKWEASPDGIMFKKWEDSPAGKKVYASEAKIRKPIKDFTNMTGIVTSLSLPPGSRLGFGIMVSINGDQFILAFGPEILRKKNININDNFEQLHRLKVNDKIIIRSHFVSHAPKYLYPIITGDYVELNGKMIYRRTPRKGGC